jgi:predicted transcriptional regulator YdeE
MKDSMEPKIVTKEEFCVIGIERRINIDRAQVLELWDDFKKRAAEVRDRAQDKYFYSICKYDPNFSIQNLSESTQLDLLMGVEVNSLDDIPRDMISKKIPTKKYAVFRATNQDQAYEYIYGQWSYNSKYSLEEADDFER